MLEGHLGTSDPIGVRSIGVRRCRCENSSVCWWSDFIYTALCLSGRLSVDIRDFMDLTFIECPL